MSRESKIQYNPSLSVKQNAKKNGVSEAGIRYYIKVNAIDRWYDRKKEMIDKCRKYIKKHPLATKTELHKELGYAVSWLRQNWQYITTNTELKESNKEKQEKRNQRYTTLLSNIPIDAIKEYLEASNSNQDKEVRVKKGEELWSDVLKDIPQMLQMADETEVSQLRAFFMEKPEMPMLFVGSGGKSGAFPAFLYSMNKGVGIALTPLQFASLSDSAIKGSRILLMSESGRNDDINYASKRAVELNAENTACITSNDSENNHLLKNLNGTAARIFLYESSGKSGFTSVRGKFNKYALYLKAFAGIDGVSSLIDVDLNPEHCFKYEYNAAEGEPVNLEKIEHYCILYGGYGEPVAYDFESVMVESGLASVQVSDYRNYCHGRFIFPTNHTENDKEPRHSSNVAMVLLVSPRERNLVRQIRECAIPKKTPVIVIETEFDNALASLDLLVKTNVLIGYIGEQCKRINPYSPPNYIAEDIDKRKPIYTPKFIKDLKNAGELQYVGGKKDEPQRKATKKKEVDVGELKSLLDELKEVEKKNSESLQSLPTPKIEDLTRWEEYNAAKYLCYAFRKKPDKRKGVWIPFGNMNSGFPFTLDGHECLTSESAYICGMFSDNEPQHIKLQDRLLKETNGRKAKKDIRHANEGIARKDWYDFNVQWMLYVVWQKVKGNQEFRDLLMAVPEGATIIEDTSFQHGSKDNDTTAFWGAKNNERKDFAVVMKKHLAETKPDAKKGTKKKMLLEQLNDYTDYGTFRGRNVMGKILTICRKCLADGTEPPIDYELLRSKHIHLLGKEQTF